MTDLIVHSNTPAISRPALILERFIWTVLAIVDSLLLIRFVLRLLAANPAAPFTKFMYALAQPFVAPFIAVFRSTLLVNAGVIEWSTLLAILIYYLLAVLLVRILTLPSSTPSHPTVHEIRENEHGHVVTS